MNNNFFFTYGISNYQGLQILLISGVTVTSASQILESFWNIWSQVSQQKRHFQTLQHVVLACIHYREGYVVVNFLPQVIFIFLLFKLH